MIQNIYYDKGPCLSYKAFLNFIISNRGGGKTYGFKTWCKDDFEKTGHQFVWIRRYGTEIKKMKKKFFMDIAKRYPNDKFEIKGDNKYGTFLCNNKIIGYYIALSTSALCKSDSFPLVDKIVFDEFLIIGNTYHYLKDEVDLLLELIETIFRNREDDPTAVQPRGVYLLGNNITFANQYFLYFNIPNFNDRFYRNKERGILVEKYTNEEFLTLKRKSKIGKLTAGTKYNDYAIENKSYLDNNKFIASKTNNSKFYCAIDYKGATYGFWLDYRQGNMYVNKKYDPNSYDHYCLTKEDHTINTFLIKNKNGARINNLVFLFQAGCMYFENVQIKSQVFELLSYFVR